MNAARRLLSVVGSLRTIKGRFDVLPLPRCGRGGNADRHDRPQRAESRTPFHPAQFARSAVEPLT